MLSSLYSGVQGISANASSLGVIGANIANVNPKSPQLRNHHHPDRYFLKL